MYNNTEPLWELAKSIALARFKEHGPEIHFEDGDEPKLPIRGLSQLGSLIDEEGKALP